MKEDQRVYLTKRLLREGLLKLLQTKDIDKITVAELCRESGINRATFYRHYEKPRDIVTQIRYEIYHDIQPLARGGIQADRWLEDICQYFYDRSALLCILFRCRTDEEFVALIDQLCRQHFTQLCQAFTDHQPDEGELKLTTYCFAGGIYYILRQWLTEPIDKTPQQVAGVIRRFVRAV